MTPIGSPSRSSGTPSWCARPDATASGERVVRVGADVRDMHDLAFERHPASNAIATGDNGSLATIAQYSGVAALEKRRT